MQVFLHGEFHRHGSLAAYSPWGCRELDMTECLSTACSENSLTPWNLRGNQKPLSGFTDKAFHSLSLSNFPASASLVSVPGKGHVLSFSPSMTMLTLFSLDFLPHPTVSESPPSLLMVTSAYTVIMAIGLSVCRILGLTHNFPK